MQGAVVLSLHQTGFNRSMFVEFNVDGRNGQKAKQSHSDGNHQLDQTEPMSVKSDRCFAITVDVT